MQPAPYSALTPDCVLDSLASIGLTPDGRLLALNSYENRVYQMWMEEGPPLVAKFYRPGRWSDAQIQEEHEFARELAGREIPIVAPVAIAGRLSHVTGCWRAASVPRIFSKPGRA
jgi:Ser/Thr protein kinase RdoA (MazF antagonist)